MAALPVKELPYNYGEDQTTARDFVEKCVAPAVSEATDNDEDPALDELILAGAMDLEGSGSHKYHVQLQRIANREQEKLVIDLDDIERYQGTSGELVARIKQNARRYVEIFCRAIDGIMPVPTRDLSSTDDVLDVIMHQRREQNVANAELDENQFPPQLLRRYNLYFKPQSTDKALAVRDVRGIHLGKLITVRGIVTRVSEVKPLLIVNAFSCDMCGAEVFQTVPDKTITPLVECPSAECQQDGVRGRMHMQTRASKFSSFQEVKIQEMADQVPVGHIPRSMTVQLHGNTTRSVTPGDIVHISGIFLPTPYTGFRAMRLGLLTDTYLEAHHVRQLKKQYEAMAVTPRIEAELEELKRAPRLYDQLAQSIAPEIYGHDDVKKALLLLLVGGVTKAMGDGMKIRGDINICLMGDPGVAKSQLLKYITKVAPRGVYTTGRGSSGVGLTAAVMRDPVTDEMVLGALDRGSLRSLLDLHIAEGGALVLADNGIACIDEFDKMDESDRTAIHEVMEQQTISISKAGITTTLNARTSILAAANPLYGRYNPKISPVDNINLPAALLSRFDLLFLILDTPTREDDERLAQHVTYVHMNSTHPVSETRPIDPLLMRHYIAQARQRRPVVPEHVSNFVVGAYIALRQNQKDDEARNKAFTYTSARTLLAILRLSQALARLRFADEVDEADVKEALRLMSVSKASLDDDSEEPDRDADKTTMSKIYQIIRGMALQGAGRSGDANMEVDDQEFENLHYLRDIRERVFALGFNEDQLRECLIEYEDLNVWRLTDLTLEFLQS